jgi:hypothetical protein
MITLWTTLEESVTEREKEKEVLLPLVSRETLESNNRILQNDDDDDDDDGERG